MKQRHLTYPTKTDLPWSKKDQQAKMSIGPTQSFLYLIHTTGLAKPHALEHLTTDLCNYNSEIAIITESRLKKHHSDASMSIHGFDLFRRDSDNRKGGGAAIYRRSQLGPTPFQPRTQYPPDRTIVDNNQHEQHTLLPRRDIISPTKAAVQCSSPHRLD